MPGRFAIADGAGVVVNVIAYDPADEYDPGDGLVLVELADDSPASIGDTIDVATAKVLAVAEPAPVELTDVEKLTALLVAKNVLTKADVDAVAATTTKEAMPHE